MQRGGVTPVTRRDPQRAVRPDNPDAPRAPER